MINGYFTAISGHFPVNCHKTEVQTVILMCLTNQNSNMFKSHDTKCTLMLHPTFAKSEIDHQNLHLINGQFTTLSGHFCANYMKIFHKTEVQTVIFEVLNKSESWLVQDLWHKPQKTQEVNKRKCIFFYNITKKMEMEIFAFWVITFESIKV